MLDAAAPIIQSSVTTDEIDRVVHAATITAGANFNVFFFLKHLYKSYQLFIYSVLVSLLINEAHILQISGYFLLLLVFFPLRLFL